MRWRSARTAASWPAAATAAATLPVEAGRCCCGMWPPVTRSALLFSTRRMGVLTGLQPRRPYRGQQQRRRRLHRWERAGVVVGCGHRQADRTSASRTRRVVALAGVQPGRSHQWPAPAVRQESRDRAGVVEVSGHPGKRDRSAAVRPHWRGHLGVLGGIGCPRGPSARTAVRLPAPAPAERAGTCCCGMWPPRKQIGHPSRPHRRGDLRGFQPGRPYTCQRQLPCPGHPQRIPIAGGCECGDVSLPADLLRRCM